MQARHVCSIELRACGMGGGNKPTLANGALQNVVGNRPPMNEQSQANFLAFFLRLRHGERPINRHDCIISVYEMSGG